MAFPRLGKLFTQAFFNGILDRMERQNIDQHGRGVLSGCEITAGTGLEINISAGWILGASPIQCAAVSAVPVPASSTRYVFVDGSGSAVLSATDADPGGESVCLGSVTTDGSSVTAINTVSRWMLARAAGPRHFVVGNGALDVDEQVGIVAFGLRVVEPVAVATITASRPLSVASARIHRIQCAAPQKVLLPDPGDVDHGFVFEIYNDNAGGGADVTVRDHSDSTTIATLAPESVGRYSLNFDGDGWIAR